MPSSVEIPGRLQVRPRGANSFPLHSWQDCWVRSIVLWRLKPLGKPAVAKQLALSVVNCNVARANAVHATRLGWTPDKGTNSGARARTISICVSGWDRCRRPSSRGERIRGPACSAANVLALLPGRVGLVMPTRLRQRAKTSAFFRCCSISVGRIPDKFLCRRQTRRHGCIQRTQRSLKSIFFSTNRRPLSSGEFLTRKLLAAAASKAGVASLLSWDPGSIDELRGSSANVALSDTRQAPNAYPPRCDQ